MTIAGLAILVLGLVSYRHGVPCDKLWIGERDAQSRVQLALIGGMVHAVYSAPDSVDSATTQRRPTVGPMEKKLGPFYMRRVPLGQVTASGAGAPFWALVPLFLVWPVVAFLHGPFRRWRRRRAGRCVQCGYALTGLPEPRCPECGVDARPANM